MGVAAPSRHPTAPASKRPILHRSSGSPAWPSDGSARPPRSLSSSGSRRRDVVLGTATPQRPASNGCSQPKNLHQTGARLCAARRHSRAQNQSIIITVPRGTSASWLRLHRLEKGEDNPERLVIQPPRPVGHALVRSAMRDREVEHVGHVLAVATLEPAEVSGRIGADRIRPMAMRAILVEEAAPRGGLAGVALVRVFGRDRRIVRARIPRRTGQTKEDGDVLLAIKLIGDRTLADPGPGVELPQFLAGFGIERLEPALDVAVEDEPAACR